VKRGCVSAIDSNGKTIWIVDAHRDDGKRFVVRLDAMNRKQKVLTVIALIAFTVIGACHYLAWIPHEDYSAGKYREETAWRVENFEEGKSGNVPPGATWVHDGYWQVPTTSKVLVPDYYSTLGFVDSKESMLPHVMTPWFMLGVIYVGLFFLLADKKEKQ